MVELVVVIAILGILAAIAVPRLLGFQERAREQADKQTAVQVRNAVALLHANGEIYPDAATGTTFTVNAAGTFAYTVDTFYTTSVAASQLPAAAIAIADFQLLVQQLTGALTLESTNKIIEIEGAPVRR